MGDYLPFSGNNTAGFLAAKAAGEKGYWKIEVSNEFSATATSSRAFPV
jgi:hypothetical protein